MSMISTISKRTIPAIVACCLPTATVGASAVAPQDPNAARDNTIVETLIRLGRTIDDSTPAKLRAAVMRHLKRHEGTTTYVEIAGSLGVRSAEPDLVRLAVEKPSSTVGVQAGELLRQWGRLSSIREVINQADDEESVAAIELLGNLTGGESLAILKPLVVDRNRPRIMRIAAARAIGRRQPGQRFLLRLVEQSEIPAELHFTVANILFSARDPRIKTAAAKFLQLPSSASENPLPPVAELIKKRGDVQRGRKLFHSTATCHKCHKVKGVGKEVGPDLSEIGSKLSRKAMFVSILDPSAGISHNYETYVIGLNSGDVVVGVLISKTDDTVTVRTAEAIEKTFSIHAIEAMKKDAVSIMPADLQKLMTEQDLVDVVEFLVSLRKNP